jgi:hypothetical protein
MKSTIVLSAFVLLPFILTDRGVGDQKKDGKVEKEIDRIQRLLSNHAIQTKALEKEMPLPKFLATLEGLLPKGSKVSLRVDADAFGKDLAKVTERKIAGFPADWKMSLDMVLRKALRPVNGGVQLDYGIRDNAIVITRPRLAAYPAAYLVRDVVELMPRLRRQMPRGLPGGNKNDVDLYDDIGATDGPGLLVRLLTNAVDLEEWEGIEVHNGIRLTVLASPSRQCEVADLLAALRRTNDVSVVMNARLYEMDRAVFTKHIAPHFAKQKVRGEAPSISQIDAPLLEILTKQNLLAESEDEKLLPDQEAAFLSQQSVFRLDGGVMHGGRKKTGTGLAGVSFRVRPRVSPDRRFLTLRITQRVTKLVGIARTTKLDVSTGKEVPVESPNRRETTVRGSVHMPDSDAIVMPVDYRPPGKAGEDKVWLLVARPFIWIEEEVKSLRQQGENLTPQSIWKTEIPKKERADPDHAPLK